jgi:protein-tyrosine phosphatase
MVINATNTDRYYDSREISNLDIEYHKLPTSGRSFVECEAIVKSFTKAVDDFMERNKDNDLLIGVHCTDGVNRAGYLICRYLIDRMCLSSHEALNG